METLKEKKENMNEDNKANGNGEVQTVHMVCTS